MTSETAKRLAEAAEAVERLREEMAPMVYARLDELVRERYPSAVGYEVVAEMDDGQQYPFLAAVTDAGGRHWELCEDEEWDDALREVLPLLLFVSPGDYRNGAGIGLDSAV